MVFLFYLYDQLFYSFVIVIGLTLAMSVISLGLDNTLSTVLLTRWVFLLPKHEIGLQKYIPNLNKLITYCHVSGAISTLVGIIAVCITPESYDYSHPAANYPFAMGIGIALLTLLYATMLAELILRPLKHQIERLLIQHQSRAISR